MRLDDLYEPTGIEVSGPMPLLIMTDGWFEASETLARAYEAIVGQTELKTIATFDTDQLLDQRARRPTLVVVDGIHQGVEWPNLELAVGTDADGKPFLLLHGPEPDFCWRPFARAVASICRGIGVSVAVAMGAYPAPVPHTRPPVISSTASSVAMLAGREHTTGQIAVPVGIFAAIVDELAQHDVPFFGVFAQLPYYISTYSWPQSSLAMVSDLVNTAQLRFDTTSLEALIPDATRAVCQMVEDARSLQDVVTNLEKRYDELRKLEEDLPSGDDLEQEFQQYLRKIDDD